MKFLEDLIDGSGQFHDTLFERDHYQGQTSSSSHRLVVIHTYEVETGIRPVIKNPQTLELVDHVVEEHQNVGQPIEYSIEQQVPHETTLRRSTRVRNSAISSNYVMYLQELDYNIGAEHDLETFSQAINSKELNLWYNAMKDEMDSMASNQVWDLVKLPCGIKTIGCQ